MVIDMLWLLFIIQSWHKHQRRQRQTAAMMKRRLALYLPRCVFSAGFGSGSALLPLFLPPFYTFGSVPRLRFVTRLRHSAFVYVHVYACTFVPPRPGLRLPLPCTTPPTTLHRTRHTAPFYVTPPAVTFAGSAQCGVYWFALPPYHLHCLRLPRVLRSTCCGFIGSLPQHYPYLPTWY